MADVKFFLSSDIPLNVRVKLYGSYCSFFAHVFQPEPRGQSATTHLYRSCVSVRDVDIASLTIVGPKCT